jgi:hypothetical protein
MIVKIVTFFLIGMAVLAMFGRLRWPGGARRVGRGRKGSLPRPRTCPRCGRINVTGGACETCNEGRG